MNCLYFTGSCLLSCRNASFIQNAVTSVTRNCNQSIIRKIIQYENDTMQKLLVDLHVRPASIIQGIVSSCRRHIFRYWCIDALRRPRFRSLFSVFLSIMSNDSQHRNRSLSRSYSSLPKATPALYTSISDRPTNLDGIIELKKLGATTASKLYNRENHIETTVFVLMHKESYHELESTLHGIAANINHGGISIGPVMVVVIVDGIKKKKSANTFERVIHTDLISDIQSSSGNGFSDIDDWNAHKDDVLDENYTVDPSNPNFILRGKWPEEHFLGVLDIAIVVKDLNQGKAHSHCLASYSARSQFIMFVDCGTVLDAPCLSRMTGKMNSDNRIIGLTARQRAHVLEPMARCLFAKESQDLLLKSKDEVSYTDEADLKKGLLRRNDTRKHGPVLSEANKSLPSLYEYLFSVVPLQVAEFEATFLLNMEAFNMIGSLPVLPGPCQFYDLWLMINEGVIDKYFQLTQDLSAMQQGSLFERMIWFNARLAEDRILSFIATAMTGKRTHVTTGTCFYYDPMRNIMSLLKQRRRWINGTEVINAWLLFVNAGNKITGTRYIANKAFLFIQLWQSVVVLLSPIVVIYAIATALIYLDKSTGNSIWRYVGYFLGWSWFFVVVSWTIALTPWCTEKLQALGSYLNCSDWCDPAICYIADRFPFGLMRWCLKTDKNGVVIRSKDTGMASLADYNTTVVIPIAVISIVVSSCIMVYLTGAFIWYTSLNGFLFFQVAVLLISLCPFILAFLKCEPSIIGVLMTVYIQYTLALLFYNYIIAFYALANIHDVSWSSDDTESITPAVNEVIGQHRNFTFDCCCLKMSIVDIAAFFHITKPKHLTNLLCMTFTIFNIVLGIVCVLAVDPEYGGGNASNLINQRALVVVLFFIFLTPVFVNIIAVCISTLKRGCVFMTNDREPIERTRELDSRISHLEYNKGFEEKMKKRLDELESLVQVEETPQPEYDNFVTDVESNDSTFFGSSIFELFSGGGSMSSTLQEDGEEKSHC